MLHAPPERKLLGRSRHQCGFACSWHIAHLTDCRLLPQGLDQVIHLPSKVDPSLRRETRHRGRAGRA